MESNTKFGVKLDNKEMIRVKGELEIDTDRGVIYFHTSNKKMVKKFGGVTLLRICGLPRPIPEKELDITLLRTDIRWMSNWTGRAGISLV